MKFAVAFLAVLALASPLSAFKLPASGSGALAKELQDLADMVPFDKTIPIIKAYAAQDKEVQVALKVLQSSELNLFVSDVVTIPAVRNLLKYIQNAGLHIISLINKMNDILDLGYISALDDFNLKISNGIIGLGKGILVVVPEQKIWQAIEEKINNSKVFYDFFFELLKPEAVKADCTWNNIAFRRLVPKDGQWNIIVKENVARQHRFPLHVKKDEVFRTTHCFCDLNRNKSKDRCYVDPSREAGFSFTGRQ